MDNSYISNQENFEFRFTDHQLQIFEGLFQLVGPGIADLYKDACRLMSGTLQPPLKSTTNLVALYVREIESAIRSVLAPHFISKQEAPICNCCNSTLGNKENNHSRQIKVILENLNIKMEEEIAKEWISIPNKKVGLQRFTHRPGLRPLRIQDDQFYLLWEKMQFIFHGILDAFQSNYIKIFNSIEKLAKKENPTSADADFFLNSVPNNVISYNCFFENLKNPLWLKWLKSKKVFENPPRVIVSDFDGEKRINFPSWPQAFYLINMAEIEPVAIKDILSKLDDNDNPYVINPLLEIACILPPSNRKMLSKQIVKWVKNEYSYIIENNVNKIINKFIDDGDIKNAIEISRIHLQINSINTDNIDSRETGDGMQISKDQLEDWYYSQFLSNAYPRIVKLNSYEAFKLSSDLLLNYLVQRYPNHEYNEFAFNDHSDISRPSIEEHEQNGEFKELLDELIGAVRETAFLIGNADSNLLSKITLDLVNRKWLLFIRIALNLISKIESPNPKIVEKLLINKEYFLSRELHHEYSLLIQKHFGSLNSSKQETIYNWILKASEIKIKLSESTLTMDERLSFLERWQLKKLIFIKKYLENNYLAYIQKLLINHEEPSHPEFDHYTNRIETSYSIDSDLTIDLLSPNEIIDQIKSYKSHELDHHFNPALQKLTNQFINSLRQNSKIYQERVKDLFVLETRFIKLYIDILEELVHNNESIKWESIFLLSNWVIKQSHLDLDSKTDWSKTKGSIAYFISTGLKKNEIPFVLRNETFHIINELLKTKLSNEEDFNNYPSEDYVLFAMNTVRGKALVASIDYGVWVIKNSSEDTQNDLVKEQLVLMPELEAILNQVIAEESVLLRAIFGKSISRLLYIDKDWMSKQKGILFPKHVNDKFLYKVAWESYLTHHKPHFSLFEFLRDEYQIALEGFVKISESTNAIYRIEEKITHHMLVMYIWGKINLQDSLMTTFLMKANDSLFGKEIHFIGINLYNDKIHFTSDEVSRLSDLWEIRLCTVTESNAKEDYDYEMSAYGWWFSSGKFPDAWSCNQYLKTLDFGSKTDTQHFVFNRLSKIAINLPMESMQLFDKLIWKKQPNGMLMNNFQEKASTLRKILSSNNPTAIGMAEKTINRLVAKGQSSFGNLLKSN